MSEGNAKIKSLNKKGQLMPKARMTAKEKDFYQKMLKVIQAGVKPSDMPGPMWQKWVNLHLNKTY